MANHKSALKRIRQSAVRRDRNKYYHKSARTAIKALRTETEDENLYGIVTKVEKILKMTHG